ncbi:hypothetical protein [Marinitenerispora sediminis]|uniref:Uncharacterized protein n=1 Tax=Marinitenerispora sediminis TaxID=1931232 RepID=A0A368T501_9ACTN|nr:hypothetical protein [Marinitenerispora sediminis]RCV57280.1 hypothetical protein DEF28_01995 [Marinitenerispora sediminis]RCV58259.1 hypothetical protein DEF23_09220 [Marinitenerispora sediminis]RCV58480.1 hypothetical protein DEF24_13260 [Marinitenerispora sediminis]
MAEEPPLEAAGVEQARDDILRSPAQELHRPAEDLARALARRPHGPGAAEDLRLLKRMHGAAELFAASLRRARDADGVEREHAPDLVGASHLEVLLARREYDARTLGPKVTESLMYRFRADAPPAAGPRPPAPPAPGRGRSGGATRG